jgi:hypothetical protein
VHLEDIMAAVRKQYDKAVEELWPKCNFVKRSLLLINLESHRLHLNFCNDAELKKAKEVLTSTPVIRSPGSGKPSQVFFASPKEEVVVEAKLATDIPRVEPEIKVGDGTSYVPENRDASDQNQDDAIEHADLVDALA